MGKRGDNVSLELCKRVSLPRDNAIRFAIRLDDTKGSCVCYLPLLLMRGVGRVLQSPHRPCDVRLYFDFSPRVTISRYPRPPVDLAVNSPRALQCVWTGKREEKKRTETISVLILQNFPIQIEG